MCGRVLIGPSDSGADLDGNSRWAKSEILDSNRIGVYCFVGGIAIHIVHRRRRIGGCVSFVIGGFVAGLAHEEAYNGGNDNKHNDANNDC